MLRFSLKAAFKCTQSYAVFNNTGSLNSLKFFTRRTTTSYASSMTYLPKSGQKTVGYWLAGMAGMTWGAIFLGGITRLTESGLSMVNWHPFKELPPRNDQEWHDKFEEYKKFPEYKHLVDRDGEISLSRFKSIWYMEYLHRMWGRLLGTAFLCPAAYFYTKGYLNKPMIRRVGILGCLIGFQGLLGWFMVRSGLEDKPGVPRVSHFRLCAHLSSAAIIYSLFVWNSFSHLTSHVSVSPFKESKLLKILGHSTKALMFITLIWGAFVAGLDAGLIYNSWPKMADRWIPSDLLLPHYNGLIGNLTQNPTGVQFTHRILAYSTCTLSFVLWATTMRLGINRTGPEIRRAAHYVLAATLGQSIIGIAALVHYVPVYLGSLHQNTGIALLTSLLWYTHCLKFVPK